MPSRRLIAIDPSLTCSGWGLFRICRGELLGVGKLRSLPASRFLADRLEDLQRRVSSLYEQLELRRGDVLVSEAPTTMRDPRAALVVEQVRCLFEVLARERGMIVPGRINPRSVHHEILGLGGKQLCRADVKAAGVVTVERLYGQALTATGFDSRIGNLKRNQDIVDAVLIGALALTRITGANRAGTTLPEVFCERSSCARQTRRRLAWVSP